MGAKKYYREPNFEQLANGNIKFIQKGKRAPHCDSKMTLTIRKKTLDEAYRQNAHRGQMKQIPDEWLDLCAEKSRLNCNLFVGVALDSGEEQRIPETFKIPYLKTGDWSAEKGSKIKKLVRYFDFFCTRNEYTMLQSQYQETINCETALQHKLDVAKESFLGKTQNILLGFSTLGAEDEAATDVHKLVKNVLHKAANSKDVMLMLCTLSKGNHHTLKHAIATSVMTAYFSRHLDMSLSMREKLVTCGLLHNIGLYYVDPAVVLKEWRGEILSREEQMAYQTHTKHGVDLVDKLKHLGVSLPEELEYVCGQHHESYNGTGYPNHIEDNRDYQKVHVWSYKIKICSEFVTHLFKVEGDLSEAMKKLQREREHHHPGIYGSFVKMMETFNSKNLNIVE